MTGQQTLRRIKRTSGALFIGLLLIPVGLTLVTGCTKSYVVWTDDYKRAEKLTQWPEQAPRNVPKVSGNKGLSAHSKLPTVSLTAPADPSVCAAGGHWLMWGADDGRNNGVSGDGVLQPGEVTHRSLVCGGRFGEVRPVKPLVTAADAASTTEVVVAPPVATPVETPAAADAAKPTDTATRTPPMALNDVVFPARTILRGAEGTRVYLPLSSVKDIEWSDDGLTGIVTVPRYSVGWYVSGTLVLLLGGMFFFLANLSECDERSDETDCDPDSSTPSTFNGVGAFFSLLGVGGIITGVVLEPGVSKPNPVDGWKGQTQPSAKSPGMSVTYQF